MTDAELQQILEIQNKALLDLVDAVDRVLKLQKANAEAIKEIHDAFNQMLKPVYER